MERLGHLLLELLYCSRLSGVKFNSHLSGRKLCIEEERLRAYALITNSPISYSKGIVMKIVGY